MQKPFRADDAGRMHSACEVTNAEMQRRAQNKTLVTNYKSTQRGFVKKNVGGLQYKPRGDWL